MLVRRFLIALASLAACLVALAPGTAEAATLGEVSTFPIAPCFGSQMAAAPRGVYVRTCDEGDIESSTTLTNLRPDGGSTAIAVPTSAAGPVATGPGGEVWIGARSVGSVAGEAERIERIAVDGSVQAFPLAPAPAHVERRFCGLVVDKHGVAWAAIGEPYLPGYGHFLASAGGELLRIAPDGTERHFRLGMEPRGLALGPGGDLWFTAINARVVSIKSESPGFGYVGRLTPGGRMKSFPTPVPHSDPEAITLGPDGRLWFTERRAVAVGSISARGRFGREYKLRSQPSGTSLTFGPEGGLWAPASKGLLRMTPKGRQTLYRGHPEQVVTAGDGAIWVLEWGQVRRIVPGLRAKR
jgi:virginiamycin B lyase